MVLDVYALDSVCVYGACGLLLLEKEWDCSRVRSPFSLSLSIDADLGLLFCRNIRLPGGASDRGSWSTGGASGGADWLDTLASVPVYLGGLAGIAFDWVASKVDSTSDQWRAQRGYRNVAVDEDAQVLRFEDED